MDDVMPWLAGAWIDGHWSPSPQASSLAVGEPATGGVLGHVVCTPPEDVDAAVRAAQGAFPSWAATPGAQRAQRLEAIAAAIGQHRQPLARLEAANNGKPMAEALWDVDDAAACFAYYAQLARELEGRGPESIALPSPDFETYVHREPLGVVGAIVPWNFPLLMAAWKVAPALAAGCTVVLKPSELTPCSALQLAHLAHGAGLPPGVLNVVPGDASTGAALARHPGVDKVAFTGSLATGSKVMAAVAPRIANLTLELGGKSSLILLEDADLEQALEWTLFGIFWNKGEVCSATSRLLVHASIADTFCERLAQAVQDIRIGAPMEPGVKLGPLVSRSQFDKVCGYFEVARNEGLTVLCGGSPLDRPGFFVAPTVYIDVPTGSRLWQEEVFGPVLAVRRFHTDDEAIAAANDGPYGLGGAVMSRDAARADRVAAGLRAGVVWINCSQPTFVQAPWGGMKSSGLGRELGRWGLEAYQEIKQVTRYVASAPWGWFLGAPQGKAEP